uniref:Uncharacterized protein n=1 Tax=Anopheles culicifacies TaxID=139723 RepID=A0A182MQK4_9DIPT
MLSTSSEWRQIDCTNLFRVHSSHGSQKIQVNASRAVLGQVTLSSERSNQLTLTSVGGERAVAPQRANFASKSPVSPVNPRALERTCRWSVSSMKRMNSHANSFSLSFNGTIYRFSRMNSLWSASTKEDTECVARPLRALFAHFKFEFSLIYDKFSKLIPPTNPALLSLIYGFVLGYNLFIKIYTK